MSLINMDDLEKLLAEGESKPQPALDPETKKVEDQAKKDEEVARKEEQLANLNKAIREANDILKKSRKALNNQPEEEEELPKINLDDPSARAWDKHFNEKVRPMQSELDKEKEEIRTFAFQEFLVDKPSLAKNPDKVKELITIYERIKTASERTKEGVLLDLKKAYAAVFHEQLILAARQSRLEKAESDILMSDIAVSRGATAYPEKKETLSPLSEEDRDILRRWGMSTAEWQEAKKKFG